MDRFPESFKEIARNAVQKFPGDIAQAIDHAEAELRRDPEFMAHVDLYIRTTVRQIVYRARGTSTIQQKRAAFERPAINTAKSRAVNEVAADMDRYFFNGTNVGDMLGEHLDDHANHAEKLAAGHQQNSRLFRMLRALVPDGFTVRQKVSPKKFAALVRKSARMSEVFAEAGH